MGWSISQVSHRTGYLPPIRNRYVVRILWRMEGIRECSSYETCWLLPWSHSAPDTVNHIGEIGGCNTHERTCVIAFVCVCVMPRHKKMGDLFYSLQRSLPSTQACQRLNWFSIVNLRSGHKENAGSLMLLLWRPQSSLELFPAQKTKANGSRRHKHFFLSLACWVFGPRNLDTFPLSVHWFPREAVLHLLQPFVWSKPSPNFYRMVW